MQISMQPDLWNVEPRFKNPGHLGSFGSWFHRSGCIQVEFFSMLVPMQTGRWEPDTERNPIDQDLNRKIRRMSEIRNSGK